MPRNSMSLGRLCFMVLIALPQMCVVIPRRTQSYAALIQQQINEDKQNLREKAVYGIQLTEEKLNDFRDEQIGQLKELMDEATKPSKKIAISKDSEYKT